MASGLTSKFAGGVALALLVAVVGWLGFSPETQVRETERWFMPGELGHEKGRAKPLSKNAFQTRAMTGVGRFDGDEWAKNNLLTSRLDFSHNLSRVFPSALYEKHPEFFPLEDGRRIRPPKGGRVSWQPDLGREDVAAYAADKARDYFDEKPEAVSFALGVNDGLVFGESAETKALTTPVRWFRGRPDYSNLVFTFMNRTAEELSVSHPDKYVGALAYYWTEQVPDFAVHPQVIPFLTADRSQGYDPEFLAEDRELQRRWISALRAGRSEIADRRSPVAEAMEDRSGASEEGASASRQPNKSALSSNQVALSKAREADNSQLSAPSSQLPRLRLGLYDYLYGGGFLMPRQHTQLLAEHLRYTRRLGFTDYYAEVYANWGLDGPQPWLVAQLLQDPEQSAEALLSEYYQRYFKEAAEPMRRFFERCEEQWMNQPGDSYWLKFFRNETQAILFPPEVCRELRGYLREAASLVKTRSVRARVQQVSDAFGVIERFVTMQTWRDRLNREVLSGAGSLDRIMHWLMAFREARREFVDYTRELRATQPLLIAPFKIDDYLSHDPAANALVWLRDSVELPAKELPLPLADDAELVQLWSDLAAGGSSIEYNCAFLGPVQKPRTIAGLSYGVALPLGWMSKVEPAEHYRDSLREEGEARVLRIEGSINTSVFQWRQLLKTKFSLAAVKIRGHLSPSSGAFLTLGWLDAKHRHLGMMRMSLPTGEWPEWVDLSQGGLIPENAAWVGVGLRLNNQRDGDWVEVKDFSLKVK